MELFLNKKSLGRKAISPDLYSGEWMVPYQAGELSAIGYIKGKKAAISKLVSTGPAAKLQITPITLAIASDVDIYEITVRDKAGLMVVDATDAITVKVAGGAMLIGIDNGDLNYTGLFKTETRNAYQGRILVTIQKTLPTKEFQIKATSPGLSPGNHFVHPGG